MELLVYLLKILGLVAVPVDSVESNSDRQPECHAKNSFPPDNHTGLDPRFRGLSSVGTVNDSLSHGIQSPFVKFWKLLVHAADKLMLAGETPLFPGRWPCDTPSPVSVSA